MKISQPIDTAVALSNTPAALAAKSAPVASTLAKSDATKSTQSAGVAVTVSNLARSLEASSASDAPDVDLKKVSEIRNAIASGTYQVNPEAIADKLLFNSQEMLPRLGV